MDAGGAGKNVVGERAYIAGVPDPRYRPSGSSNPDAVLGNVNKPTAAYDLKTGSSGISNAQMTKYQSNLPSGTPVYTVTPNGHNVPAPQSMAGFGAGLNTGYLLGSTGSSYFSGLGSGTQTLYGISPR